MNKFVHFLLFFIILQVFNVRTYAEDNDRLFGGEDLNLGDKLFFAQIVRDEITTCGGAILTERWIITAAHCLIKWAQSRSSFNVIVGSIVRQDATKRREEIEDVILHPSYHHEIVDNDIALIKLKSAIKFDDFVTTIDIMTRPPRAGDRMEVFGLGRVGDNNVGDSRLRSIMIPVVNGVRCRSAFNFFDFDRSFCAGLGRQDSCKGDSGGPGVIGGKLAGIVSYGPSCAMNEPAVYTNVYFYRDWVVRIVGDHESEAEPESIEFVSAGESKPIRFPSEGNSGPSYSVSTGGQPKPSFSFPTEESSRPSISFLPNERPSKPISFPKDYYNYGHTH